MGDSILKSCDSITTMKEAERPVVSVLLPVKGLRHNDKGELTEDAMKIVFEGIKTLGIQINNECLKQFQ